MNWIYPYDRDFVPITNNIADIHFMTWNNAHCMYLYAHIWVVVN
jgi:hypothetical protein